MKNKNYKNFDEYLSQRLSQAETNKIKQQANLEKIKLENQIRFDKKIKIEYN